MINFNVHRLVLFIVLAQSFYAQSHDRDQSFVSFDHLFPTSLYEQAVAAIARIFYLIEQWQSISQSRQMLKVEFLNSVWRQIIDLLVFQKVLQSEQIKDLPYLYEYVAEAKRQWHKLNLTSDRAIAIELLFEEITQELQDAMTAVPSVSDTPHDMLLKFPIERNIETADFG